MEAKKGSGRFQWNTGGWFGAQLGSTCWMLALGIILISKLAMLSFVLIMGFIVPNMMGTLIWKKREKIDPYWAIQILMSTIFVVTLGVFMIFHYCGQLSVLDPRIKNPLIFYMILLIFPAMMGMFHIQNRRKYGE